MRPGPTAGTSEPDSLEGGSGKGDLSGSAGRDALYGDSGSDTLTGGNGADFFSGGPGYDVATDFECGVDKHDGTVEVGIDFTDTNCQDIDGGGIRCTLGDTQFTCVVGPKFFICCNEDPA